MSRAWVTTWQPVLKREYLILVAGIAEPPIHGEKIDVFHHEVLHMAPREAQVDFWDARCIRKALERVIERLSIDLVEDVCRVESRDESAEDEDTTVFKGLLNITSAHIDDFSWL